MIKQTHHAGIQVDQRYTREASLLKCPRCDSDYLHHGRVICYERSEDEPNTAVLSMENGGFVAIEKRPSVDCKNPSSRRNGLTIDFYCEQCGEGLELLISQHKGQTFIGWRYAIPFEA